MWGRLHSAVAAAEGRGDIAEEQANRLWGATPFLSRDWEKGDYVHDTPSWYKGDWLGFGEINLPSGTMGGGEEPGYLKDMKGRGWETDPVGGAFGRTTQMKHGGMGKFGKATPVIMHGDEIVFSMSDLAKGKGLGTLDLIGKSLVMGLASMSSGVGIGASDTTSGGLLAGANGALANNKMNGGGGGGGGMLVNSPNTTNNTTTNNNISQGRGDSRMDESAFNIERYRLANRGMF